MAFTKDKRNADAIAAQEQAKREIENFGVHFGSRFPGVADVLLIEAFARGVLLRRERRPLFRIELKTSEGAEG